MKRTWFWLFILMALAMWTSSVGAAEVLCPQKVGTVQNTLVYKQVEQVFRQIYKKLGCELVLMEMPAKRGIASFNNHHIAGELLRTPAIEARYTRAFTRSDTLFTIRFGLWGISDKIDRIGYLRGFVVHQHAADKYVAAGRVTQSFSSNEQMFAALQRGALDGVITGELAWKAYYTAHHELPNAGIRETLARLTLHHYLSTDYAAFMRAFDQYVTDNRPFQVF